MGPGVEVGAASLAEEDPSIGSELPSPLPASVLPSALLSGSSTAPPGLRR